MTRKDISDAVDGIDDKYIEEAAEGPAGHSLPLGLLAKKLLPLAACLVVLISLGRWYQLAYGGLSGETGAGASSAPAAGGEAEPGDGEPTPEVLPELMSVLVEVDDWQDGRITGTIPGESHGDIVTESRPVLVLLEDDVQAEAAEQELSRPAAGDLLLVRFAEWEEEGALVVLFAEEVQIMD